MTNKRGLAAGLPLLLAAILTLSLSKGAQAQTTRAQYQNQDGSQSASVVIQYPDRNNVGKTTSTTPAPPYAANASSFVTPSTATTTELVAASGSTVVYVSAYSESASAADNIYFEYGSKTSTACDTGATQIWPTNYFAANGIADFGDGSGVLFKTTAGKELCVVTSAATNASIGVSYLQQ